MEVLLGGQPAAEPTLLRGRGGVEDAIGLGGKLGSWVSIETVGHAATAPGTTLVHRMIHFKTKDLPASPASQTIPQSGRPCPEGHKSLRKRLWSVSSHCVPRMELAGVCGALVCPHTYQKKRPRSSLGHSIIEQAVRLCPSARSGKASISYRRPLSSQVRQEARHEALCCARDKWV